jgi:nucleotide-binding universal stress UspA family protein
MNTAPAQAAPGLPAIIVRPPVTPVTRVIVGVDGSAGSAAALRWAAAEACRRQALLRIVSAWEEPVRPGPPAPSDPARIAAARVQKALARVFFQQDFPYRIACATPQGAAGEALLGEAGETGLLVLGAAGAAAARTPGTTGRYCLRRGRGPLVFVPASPAP